MKISDVYMRQFVCLAFVLKLRMAPSICFICINSFLTIAANIGHQ